MHIGRPAGLEGSIVALRRIQHAGVAKAAANAIGILPRPWRPTAQQKPRHGWGMSRGQKEPRA
jgi:hypothetical protein